MTDNLAQLAIDTALDKKAYDITAVDVSKKSDICDVHVICSTSNNRQSVAVANAIEEQLKTNMQQRPLAVEGKDLGEWIALDYGSMFIHIFLDELRKDYAIEDIWKTSSKESSTIEDK